MSPGRRRVLLGRDYDLGSYRKVYELADGIEIDENSFIRIERTRVYFDDVLAVTHHRVFGALFLFFTGLFGAGFLVLGLATGEEVAMVVFSVIAAPFLLAFLLRLILRVDVVTVFGRRSLARMRFSFRKGKARAIFEDLARKVRKQQAPAAPPPKPPPPAGELPPPPAAEPPPSAGAAAPF